MCESFDSHVCLRPRGERRAGNKCVHSGVNVWHPLLHNLYVNTVFLSCMRQMICWASAGITQHQRADRLHTKMTSLMRGGALRSELLNQNVPFLCFEQNKSNDLTALLCRDSGGAPLPLEQLRKLRLPH